MDFNTKIQPLIEDVGRIIPGTFLKSTEYKRWLVEHQLDEVWSQILNQVKSSRNFFAIGYERNALTDDEFSKVKSKLTDILGYDKKEQRKYDVSSNSNLIYQLTKLNELAAEGRITSDEFTKGKANLIERFGE